MELIGESAVYKLAIICKDHAFTEAHLVVAFQGLGHGIVDNKSHIWLVDACQESEISHLVSSVYVDMRILAYVPRS